MTGLPHARQVAPCTQRLAAALGAGPNTASHAVCWCYPCSVSPSLPVPAACMYYPVPRTLRTASRV